MRILILKIIKQVIYRFSERTPPHVKFSQRNYCIGRACEALDHLIIAIKNKRKLSVTN
jgi:hypothetical protein